MKTHTWEMTHSWDNHFGAYMLSLDAETLGYSALIQVRNALSSSWVLYPFAKPVSHSVHFVDPGAEEQDSR